MSADPGAPTSPIASPLAVPPPGAPLSDGVLPDGVLRTPAAEPAGPTRGLGPGFNRLWLASIASNLADGLGRTAIPLLATTLTSDPLLISGIAALSYLPWLLFGLAAGVVVDRVDRRRAMAVANGLRVLAAVGICLAIAADVMSIGVLYAAILVFGLGETVYDNATTALVPSLVPKRGLDRANARMQASDIVVQNFLATPVAGVLFAVAVVLPLWSTAAGFAVAGLLVLTLPAAAGRAARSEPDPTAPIVASPTARQDVAESVRFLWNHRLLRGVLVLTTVVGASLTFAQASSILLFLDDFQVPVAAIGFLTAGVGLGALVGAIIAGRLVERFGRGRVMLAATVLGGVGILLTGLTTNVYLAVASYALGAFGVAIWNVPWGALRQSLVPGHLLGRVTGLTRTLNWGTFPFAALLGGWVARVDLGLPFVLGGAVVVVAALGASRLLLSIDALGDAQGEARDDAQE